MADLGYEVGTKAAERRAFYDLRRQLTAIEQRLAALEAVEPMPGPPGPQGPQGDPGPPGGTILSAFWQYAATTTAPPGGGQVRIDAARTTMWVHETDTDGFVRTFGLSTIRQGDQILLRAANGGIIDFLITAPPIDSGAYWTFHVSVIRGASNSGSRTQLNFVRPEDALLPPGGSAGQVLAKVDATDYHTHWTTP